MSDDDPVFSWGSLSPGFRERAMAEISVVRYVTAAMYVVLLLEYLYSIPQEIEYIWKAPPNFARMLFLAFRYSTLGGMTLLMHAVAGESGLLTDDFCKRAVAALAALAVMAIGVADIIVLLRVSVLWGRRRAILGLLFLTFCLTYGTAISCAAIGASRLVEYTIFVPELKTCLPIYKPYAIIGVWAPGAVFDILVFSLTTWNAFARPRSGDTALMKTLHRDGIAYFLVLAVLRAFNLFMIIFSSTSFLVGICVSWPLAAITVSRFLFHVREAENVPTEPNLGNHTVDFGVIHLHPEGLDEKYRRESPKHSDEAESPVSRLQMWEVLETRSAENHGPARTSSPTWIERFIVENPSGFISEKF